MTVEGTDSDVCLPVCVEDQRTLLNIILEGVDKLVVVKFGEHAG